MKLYSPIIVLLSLLLCFSCQNSRDDYWDKINDKNYQSPYQGTYIGNYTGIDYGTLLIKISSKDVVEVTRISQANGSREIFYGTIIESSFYNVRSQSSRFEILGNLVNSTSTFTGTWKQDGNSGSWQISKQ